MTWNHNLAQGLTRASAAAPDLGRAKRLERLSDDFRSGGFDEKLMARFAAAAGDLDADVAEITHRVITEVETFRPEVLKADDLLRVVLREIGA